MSSRGVENRLHSQPPQRLGIVADRSILHSSTGPRVTIQIVGWNSEAHLQRAVAVLAKIPPGAAVIRYIDNASSDGSVRVMREGLPEADVIELDENMGYAAAHNVGFARCETEYVLTHDPDVELSWGGIHDLLQYMVVNPGVGAVQGKLLRSESSPSTSLRVNETSEFSKSRVDDVIDSAGIVLTLALNGRERGAGETDAGQYDEEVVIDAVTGACGLYRMQSLKFVQYKPDRPSIVSRKRGVFAGGTGAGLLVDGAASAASLVRLPYRAASRAVFTATNKGSTKPMSTPGVEMGVFDEDFFAYKEDVDLGWRLQNAGWRNVYVPVLTGYHSRTLGKRGLVWVLNREEFMGRLSDPRTRYSLRNYVWMIVKNATWKDILIHGIFIEVRLDVLLLMSLFSLPLLKTWVEIFRGLPRMIEKRKHPIM